MTQVTGLVRPLIKRALDVDGGIRDQAIRDILAAGTLAAAGGIGARGLLGLKYMFGRRKPNLARSFGPTVISVPTPVYVDPKDEQRAQKYATAISRSELPWYLPGITMAGIGGLAGGYKLMDYLMDKKRKRDLQSEVDAARDQYRQAILDQYNPAVIPSADKLPDVPLPAKTVNAPPGAAKLRLKTAADPVGVPGVAKPATSDPVPGAVPGIAKSAELHRDLDALFEKVAAEKAAELPGWAGKSLGILGTFASLLALGSGAAAYRLTKDRSTNKLMEDALKQRERERWARRPPEIYAIPTPVKLTRGGDVNQVGAMPTLPGTEGM